MMPHVYRDGIRWRMRKIQWLTLVLLLLAVPVLFAHAETAAKIPKPTGYIDDYAHVFSAPAKDQMESLCRELHDKTKAQVFVVTINSLDGATIEQFTNDLFHTWKIGEKKTDRGVLLLFAIKDHKYRYEIGYGLEEILNDAKVGDMGRAIVPDLRASDYDGAATFGLNQVAQVIADDSKVQLDGLKTQETLASEDAAPPPPVGEPPSSESPTGKFILALLPFFFILTIIGIVAWAVIRAVRNGTASWGGGSSSSSDSSSSSSDSSSSSNDSFSGGDGGDSGGGGASGSW
jgi:uncharacterized protein